MLFFLMASAATPLSLKDIFRYKPFRRLWMAQFVSIFGDFLALFGVISMIAFRLHGKAVDVTAVTIAYVLPFAIVGPPAGVFVDRWNVKRVMITSDLVRAVLILLLLFVTDVREICAIFVVLSCVSAFFNPAQSVTLRTIVPKEGLLAANAMMSQAFYTVRILSPAAAGALVALLTEKSTFYLDSASFFFSALMLSSLTIIRPVAEQGGRKLKSLTAEFLEGNKFIFTHSALAFVFIAMSVAMFVMSAFSPLISIFVRDSLPMGPTLSSFVDSMVRHHFMHDVMAARSFFFGIISAMIGVGMIAGTQFVSRVARNRPKPHVVVAGLLVLGAEVALLGLFHTFYMAALSTFTMGFSIAFVIVPAQTLSQQETPPAMVGRVSSSFLSLLALSQTLGLLLSGYLAQALGVQRLFLACAATLVLLSGIGYLWIRERQPIAATAGNSN